MESREDFNSCHILNMKQPNRSYCYQLASYRWQLTDVQSLCCRFLKKKTSPFSVKLVKSLQSLISLNLNPIRLLVSIDQTLVYFNLIRFLCKLHPGRTKHNAPYGYFKLCFIWCAQCLHSTLNTSRANATAVCDV